ncbi:MAG: MotA/TolQ/ExbB proton channel family protein, partial [Bacteroidota bacterium]
MIFTQITTVQDTTDVLANSTDSVRIIDLLLQGGFMMIPILVLSIVAVYIFVERVRTINGASKTPDEFMSQIRQQVEKGDVNGAKLTCQHHDSPVARIEKERQDKIEADTAAAKAEAE